MKTIKNIDWTKLLTAATAVTIAVAPLTIPTTVQAQTSDVRYAAANRANRQTITGVVTRDLDGDTFALRASNGTTYYVNTRGAEPGQLSRGDRVRVRGYMSRNSFIADTVRILRNQADTSENSDTTLSGTVGRDLRGDTFTLTTDNGRTYLVDTRGSEPGRLSPNDRVQVRGFFGRDAFYANSVRILSDRDNNGNSSTTTLVGIIGRDMKGDTFTLRTDDGRTHYVDTRGIEPSRLSAGDRVQVHGYFGRDAFYANSVRIVSDRDGRDGVGQGNSVDYTATVLSIGSSRRFNVRDENGRTVQVVSESALSTSVNVGDEVRIVGYMKGNQVMVDRVQVVNNNGGRYIEIKATVTDVDSRRRMTVRTPEGRTYRVTAAVDMDRLISVGDIVKILGTVEGTSITADRIVLRGDTNGRSNGRNDRDYDRDNDGRYDEGQRVNFTGTVASATDALGVLKVRADNGTSYTVRFRGGARFRKGDRVRVAGTYSRKVVNATSIREM